MADNDRILASALRDLVEPAVNAAGCDLEDLSARVAGRRRLVTILVDRDGGVDLDTVADISRVVGEVLDTPAADELIKGAYVLEVSSPGVDRPLTLPRHWRRNHSRLVAITLNGGQTVTGRIMSSDETSVVIDAEGTSQSVTFTDISRALIQVEFRKDDTHDESGDQ